MDDDELEELRKRKLQEQYQAAYLEQKLKEVMQTFLEGAAYERAMNIRSVNPTLYRQLAMVIAQLADSGRLSRKLTEKELLVILSRLSGSRRDPTIEIRRK
ncbi:MAG: DNA-binding protein [Candidatus Micrarchaeia archaeon]